MTTRFASAFLLLPFLFACKSTQTFDEPSSDTNWPTSDYKTELKMPFETDDLIKIDTHVYDEPAYGVGIKYDHKLLSNDNISVFVYPINSLFWDDHKETTSREMAAVESDINLAIEKGIYKKTENLSSSEYLVTTNVTSYSGRKSEFLLTDRFDNQHYSVAYIFVAEDKFVKFRISLDKELQTSFNPDSIVNAILPQMSVPKESAYMQNKRQKHAKALTLKFYEYVKQSAEQEPQEN